MMGVATAGAGVIAAFPAAAPVPVAAPQPATPDVTTAALIDLLPPPNVGAGTLTRVGNAIVAGSALVTAPIVAVRAQLPPPPLVPAGVQLSFLTVGPPNLGAGNNGIYNVGSNNSGVANVGIRNPVGNAAAEAVGKPPTP